MIYVQQYGALWKMPLKNYRKLLTLIKNKQEYDLGELGTCVTISVKNVVDMTPEQAREQLEGTP